MLPPLLAMMVEEIAFDTGFVSSFLRHRLVGIWGHLGVGRGLGRELEADGDELPPLGRILDTIDASPVFTHPDLWLGVAAAALLVFAAIRIRRYRDDS